MDGAIGGTLLRLVAMFALVLLNGFFVAAEFSLVSVRKSRIDQLANEGSARARQVARALQHLDLYIAATQLGITMASLALGFVAEPAIAALLEPLFVNIPFLHGEGAIISSHTVALVIAFAIATALHIVFGELAPKSIALQRTEATALWITTPLNIFAKIFRLPITFLNNVGNGVVRLIRLAAERRTWRDSLGRGIGTARPFLARGGAARRATGADGLRRLRLQRASCQPDHDTAHRTPCRAGDDRPR